MLTQCFLFVIFLFFPQFLQAVSITTNNCTIILSKSPTQLAVVTGATDCMLSSFVFNTSLSVDVTTQTPLAAIPSRNKFAAIDFESSSLLIYDVIDDQMPTLVQVVTENIPVNPISVAASPDGSLIAVISATTLAMFQLINNSFSFCIAIDDIATDLKEVLFQSCPQDVLNVLIYSPTIGLLELPVPPMCVVT